jgi:hypothetical protein
MRRGLTPGAARPRRTWPDRLWAVLAGAVIAAGLLGAFSAYGGVGLLLGYTTLSLFALVVFWGLSQEELAIDRPAVVRLGLGTALGMLVLLGLCELSPRYGMAIAAVVALGSPRARRLVARLRRRLTRSSAGTGLVDPVVVDRRFDDIVRQLRQSGDLPES